jgi:pimeloyl-ACP methyl ester carboxylesterase
MGGWTAMRLALAAPDRVASVLVGGAQPYGQTLEPLRQLLARGLDAFIAAVERGRTLPAAAKARFQRNDPRALAAVIARDRDPIDTSSLRVPLFAWAGEHDALAALVTRFANERGGELVLVPRAGHFAAFDDPLLLRAASSWIAERSTSLSSKRNTWSLPDAST